MLHKVDTCYSKTKPVVDHLAAQGPSQYSLLSTQGLLGPVKSHEHVCKDNNFRCHRQISVELGEG